MRRVGLLLLLMVPVGLLLVVSARLVLVNNDRTLTPLNVAGRLRRPEPVWLGAVGAIGVPGALREIGAIRLEVRRRERRDGWSRYTLNDVITAQGLVVRLTATCDIAGATETPSDQPGHDATSAPIPTAPGRHHVVHDL